MLLEWEFSAKERSYLEKLDIPENLIHTARENGIEFSVRGYSQLRQLSKGMAGFLTLNAESCQGGKAQNPG